MTRRSGITWSHIIRAIVLMNALTDITVACLFSVSQITHFTCTGNIMSIRCPGDDKIHIIEEVRGLRQGSGCTLQPTCQLRVDADGDSYASCQGKTNCTVAVTGRSLVPACNESQLSDVLSVTSECIPGASTFDLCSNQDYTGPLAYMTTPNYPGDSFVEPDLRCACVIWGDDLTITRLDSATQNGTNMTQAATALELLTVAGSVRLLAGNDDVLISGNHHVLLLYKTLRSLGSSETALVKIQGNNNSEINIRCSSGIDNVTSTLISKPTVSGTPQQGDSGTPVITSTLPSNIISQQTGIGIAIQEVTTEPGTLTSSTAADRYIPAITPHKASGGTVTSLDIALIGGACTAIVVIIALVIITGVLLLRKKNNKSRRRRRSSRLHSIYDDVASSTPRKEAESIHQYSNFAIYEDVQVPPSTPRKEAESIHQYSDFVEENILYGNTFYYEYHVKDNTT